MDKKRKALFIGGTGTISTAIVRRLSKDPGTAGGEGAVYLFLFGETE